MSEQQPRDGESRDGAGGIRPVPPHVDPAQTDREAIDDQTVGELERRQEIAQRAADAEYHRDAPMDFTRVLQLDIKAETFGVAAHAVRDRRASGLRLSYDTAGGRERIRIEPVADGWRLIDEERTDDGWRERGSRAIESVTID